MLILEVSQKTQARFGLFTAEQNEFIETYVKQLQEREQFTYLYLAETNSRAQVCPGRAPDTGIDSNEKHCRRPYIKTPPVGPVSGQIDEKCALNWHGIPYAQPPVGELRWKVPGALKPLENTFVGARTLPA